MLARLHRVRTLQLTLAQGDEARARDQLASEAQLTSRIAALADAVAPQAEMVSAVSLAASALYRERLHQSADGARLRVARAETQLDRATAATRNARQDQGAVEKLIERARAAAVVAERRAMQDAPPARGNRHDPC